MSIGPGLLKLKKSLGLSEAEVARLAQTYPDQELVGPAEFVAAMIAASTNPGVARILGDRMPRMKVELTDLLLRTKAVLLADGPDALGRYLNTHPFLNYLK